MSQGDIERTVQRYFEQDPAGDWLANERQRRRLRLQPVDDAGHPVLRLVDLDGHSMREGLFVDRAAAERFCAARGWRIES